MAYKNSKDLGATLGLGKPTAPKNSSATVQESSNPTVSSDPIKTTQCDKIEAIGDLFPKKASAKDKIITMKVHSHEYERWKKAAKKIGVSMTVFAETVLNDYCDRNNL